MEADKHTGFDPLAWIARPAQHAADSSTPTTATPTAATPTTTPQPTACQSHSPAEELALATAVVRDLIARQANIAESYEDYLKLGFSLANGLGSSGHDLYHMLCAHSTKYRREDCERKWQECLRKADGRTSIATFYHMARQAGVDLSAVAREQRNNHFYSYSK